MSSRLRLGALLRARLAQEDVAKGEMARALQEAAEAAERTRHRSRRLRTRAVPEEGAARAVAAALAARQSLATALAEAHEMAERARDRTTERMADLVEAAKARRSVERLAERYEAAGQLQERIADQRAIDDLAVTDRQRAAAREVGR